jgi:hypothetical protein
MAAVIDFSLVSSVLSRHKPPSWSDMPAGTEVQLVELDTSSQEFISVREKIKRRLSVAVDRVVRVQNPYLYGKCNVAVCSGCQKDTVDPI